LEEDHLKCCKDRNHISLTTLVEWYVHTFGVAPTHLYSELAAREHISVWAELRKSLHDGAEGRAGARAHAEPATNHNNKTQKNKNKTTTEFGRICYTSDVSSRGTRAGPALDEAAVNALLDRLNASDQLTRAEEGSLFPQCTGGLGNRQKLRLSTICRAYNQVRQSEMNCPAKCSHMEEGWATLPALPRVSDLLRQMTGLGEQACVNFMEVMLVSGTMRVVLLKLAGRGDLRQGIKRAHDLLKLVHSSVFRSGDSWCPPLGLTAHSAVQARALLYCHLLVGRLWFKDLLDDEDIDKRVDPGWLLHLISRSDPDGLEFRRELQSARRERVTSAVSGLASRFGGESTLGGYLANAAAHGATGSAKELSKLRVQWNGRPVRLDKVTKTLWLMSINEDRVLKELGGAPHMRTKAVDKLEAGKLRLLLPGDLVHWLMENVFIGSVEGAAVRSDPELVLEKTQMQQIATQLRRIRWMQRQAKGEVCVLGDDFEDFNIEHTYDVLRDVMHDLLDAGALQGMSSYGPPLAMSTIWAQAGEWCAAALLNAWVSGRTRDGMEQTLRGLWTGWRSTMFFNCTLNKDYHTVIRREVQAVHGYDPGLAADYLGDDSVTLTRDVWGALLIASTLTGMGMHAQAEKQLIAPNAVEFLRVRYTANAAFASLNRAIANGNSSDSQGGEFHRGPSNAGEIESNYAMRERRGARGWANDMVKWAHLNFATSFFIDGELVQLGGPLLQVPQANGGFGCTRWGKPDAATLTHDLPELPTMRAAFVRQLMDEVSLPQVDAAVSRFKARLPVGARVEVSDKALRRRMVEATLGSVQPTGCAEESRLELLRRWALWVAASNKVLRLPRRKNPRRENSDVRVPSLVASVVAKEIDVSVAAARDWAADTTQVKQAAAQAMDLESHIVRIANSALDTIAPITSAINDISSDRASWLSTVVQMGGPLAQRALNSARDMVPDHVIVAMLKGRMKLHNSWKREVSDTVRGVTADAFPRVVQRLRLEGWLVDGYHWKTWERQLSDISCEMASYVYREGVLKELWAS